MIVRAGSAALLLFSVLASPRPARATIVVEVSPDESRTAAIAEAIRAEVVRALEDRSEGALVVRVRSELPARAPDPHALVAALVHPSAAALEASGRFELVHVAAFAGEGGDAAARAGRLGYDVMVDVAVRAVGNFLRVQGGVWTTEPPRRSAVLDLRSRLDVELRSYLGALPRVSADTVVARTIDLPGRGYVAICAHDLDGDGTTELVALTPGRVSVLRLGAARGGVRLVEIATAEIPRDIPLAATPPRRPLATALERERAVVVRSSRLAAPLRVALSGGALTVTRANGPCEDAAFPVDRGCARLVEARDFFDETLAPLNGEGRPHAAPGPWYTHAARRIRTRAGTTLEVEAISTPHGRLALRIDGRAIGAVGYGTALAIADLDDDGAAELLASAATASGDQLTLLRALPRGALHVVWRSEPIEGSIWIAESADLDGDGAFELLAVEEPASPAGTARLWVVR